MSTRTRLLLGFACVMAFLLAQGLVAVWSQRTLMSDVAAHNRSLNETHRILFLLHKAHSDVALVVGTQDPTAMDRHRDHHREAMGGLIQLTQTQDLDRGQLMKLQQAYEETILLHYQFAYQMARSRLAQLVPDYEAAVAQATRHLEHVQASQERLLQARGLHVRRLTIGLAVLAFVTALLWALHLAKVLTDRRRASDSVAAALAQLKSVLEAATQVAIIWTDPNGLIRLFNRGAESMLGWKGEEMVGRASPARFHAPEEGEGPWDPPSDGRSGLFPGANGPRRSDRRITHYLTREGRTLTVDLSLSPVSAPDGGDMGLLWVAIDVSQRVEAERALREQDEQLRQVQKMDAIGQLAGGVAHDFNNMLSGILGAAELIQDLSDPEEERHHLAGLAIQASHRAADLTRKLLAFSRKAKLRSESVDLHLMVEETRDLLRRSIDRRIHLEIRLQAQAHHTMGDASQLQNALLNIAINARDAMPEGGTITLTTEDAVLGEEGSRDGRFPVQPGPYTCITVSDTGVGIPPEVLGKIFEPFFTTKPTGQGTGLGLAAVYGTVKDHGGLVTVESHPSQGTTFRLYFPVAAPPSPSENLESGAPIREHRGRVLLVDDEDVLRQTVARMLSSMGFEVLEAADGQEAVYAFEQQRGTLDLVILDMVMPHLSGADAFRRIRQLEPQARVILASGYARDASITALQTEGLKGFLQKPFLKKELLEAIESAMGE